MARATARANGRGADLKNRLFRYIVTASLQIDERPTMHRDTFFPTQDPRVRALMQFGGGGHGGHRRGGWGGGPGGGRGRGGPWSGPPFGPGFGPGGGGPGGPGGGPGWGGGGRGPGGRRARRGDVRAALLALLAEEPRNGYQLMQEIEHRSDGMWRPSPGSVYPALQQLEDEGLVVAEAVDGGRRYTLTDAGRTHVEEHKARIGEPWEAVKAGQGEGAGEMRSLVWQVGAAVMQVFQAGTPAQQEEAKKVLADTRRALYRILAEDDPGDAGAAPDAPDAPPEA
jgi:DNA-binding PadR family transcriptional regulator